MHDNPNIRLIRGLLGRDIADLRHARGMTQRDLAERLGCTRELVSHWECGRCLPDVRRLPDLLDLLVHR